MDDEAHFRNILLIAGSPNAAVRELWESKTRRSFRHVDGPRRVRDLARQLVPVQTAEGERHMVYPGEDERVMRIVRKVIRGLCHHNGLVTPVPDRRVWADVNRYGVPLEFLEDVDSAHVEEDIMKYHFAIVQEEDIHSAWLLTFFERTEFIGIVFR